MNGIADDEFDLDTQLLEPSKAVSKKLKGELVNAFGPGLEFWVAQHARLNVCDRISVGDVAVLQHEGGGYGAGQVRQLIAMTCPPRTEPFHAALVERWVLHRSRHGASIWLTSALRGAKPQYVALDEIMRAAPAWSVRHEDDRAIVINPPGYS